MTSLSLFHFHALEKEMATHSSVLAWRIPGTGVPGGLTSMESHRVTFLDSMKTTNPDNHGGRMICLDCKKIVVAFSPKCAYFYN